MLDVRSLSTVFQTARGAITAVDDVSLHVEAGAMLALVGESGSGKSVLSRTILRLLPQRGVTFSGSVVVDGIDFTGLGEREMRAHRGPTASMVFQDPMTALNPVMRLGPQITEGFRTHRPAMSARDRQAAALRLLQEVGLSAPEMRVRQYPHELSGGMRQRVTIAIALALNPKLLIADEPTTALDVTVQAQVMSLLREEQRNRQMAVVFVTHDLGLAATHADRVAVMYAGQIVETGSIRQVLRSPRSPYTGGLHRSAPNLKALPHTRLAAIPGRPPDLLTLGPGCRFAPRCRSAQQRCLDEPVPLLPTPEDPEHLYRCFFPEGTEAGDEALRRNRERGSTATGLPVEAGKVTQS